MALSERQASIPMLPREMPTASNALSQTLFGTCNTGYASKRLMRLRSARKRQRTCIQSQVKYVQTELAEPSLVCASHAPPMTEKGHPVDALYLSWLHTHNMHPH